MELVLDRQRAVKDAERRDIKISLSNVEFTLSAELTAVYGKLDWHLKSTSHAMQRQINVQRQTRRRSRRGHGVDLNVGILFRLQHRSQHSPPRGLDVVSGEFRREAGVRAQAGFVDAQGCNGKIKIGAGARKVVGKQQITARIMTCDHVVMPEICKPTVAVDVDHELRCAGINLVDRSANARLAINVFRKGYRRSRGRRRKRL